MSNYAKANTTAQWFQDNYPGSTMKLTKDNMVLVIHTTEGLNWPGYNGGATAPNYTGQPPVGAIKGAWRAHFPDEKSSRALENRAGGVQTNTQNAVQLELIGTCDPKHKKSWDGKGKYLAGVHYVYWAEATDAQLAWLADIVADLHKRHGLQLIAPAKFNPYPSSYGNTADRLTFAEWNKVVGIVGHQHIPENSHGDPGYINIAKVIAFAKGTTPPPVVTPPVVTPPVTPPKPPAAKTAVWGKPETWVIGAVGPDVKKLGDRIRVWSKFFGLPDPYKVGTGEPLTEVDVAGLSKVQVAFGYGSSAADLRKGGNSDGYPGLQTFKDLEKTPVAKTLLEILHWNIAGSDDTNGYAAANSYRGDDLGRYAKKLGFDVFLTCEASQKNLRSGVSAGLGLTSWMERAKAIWFDPKRVKNIKSRKAYSANGFSYLSTLKWGAAFFGELDGKKFSVLEIHTDYRKPAKQAKQVQAIFKKWRKDTDKLGIKHVNTYVVGDFNWDGTSGDNPFKALAAYNFEEKGSKTAHTFMERKHLDGVLAHKEAKVTVEVKPRTDGNMRLSDHNPIKAKAELQ